MKLSDRVHALRMDFTIPLKPGLDLPRFVYVFPVVGSQKVSLIDSGVSASYQPVADYLHGLGRAPKTGGRLLLSHAHPDHIGSATTWREATGCEVAAHPLERAWIEDTELQLKERPVPGFRSLVAGPTRVDRLLQDGDVLELEKGLTAEVLHTPGHSPGSVSLRLPEEKALFTGDLVPVAGEMPIYSDPVVVMRSLERVLGLSGVQVLLSSWDRPRVGEEVGKVLRAGIDYVQAIHDTVRALVPVGEAVQPMELCAQAVARLGLDKGAVNPLAAATFASHLRCRELDRLRSA